VTRIDPTFELIPGFTIIVEPSGGAWSWLVLHPNGQENGRGFPTEIEAWQGAVAWSIWRNARALLGLAIDDPSPQPWPYQPTWRVPA
jgi:hypothetical protein